VAPARRAPAATIVWMMMIFGFVITAASVGEALDPYSHSRLITLTAMVGCCALVVTCLAVWGIERAPLSADEAAPAEAKPGFFEALAEVWQETAARRFTVFVFASMLAYSAQDLILEPFAGIVFGMTPGESTKLASVQHSGVLMGMIMVALAGGRFGSLRVWTIGGCLASAVALSTLSLGAAIGPGFPLRVAVFALGAANGAFAVAAIGSMMGLAAAGRESREGMRMGLWGAAQAIAFGLGGFLGAASVDVTRIALGAPTSAYGLVFAGQAVLFVIAAMLAARVHAAVDKAPDAGAARAVGPAVPNLQGA
ncbi:MAG: PucC family protein, partial [Geminicoccaceae bacterium]